MLIPRQAFFFYLLSILTVTAAQAVEMGKPSPADASPSKDQVRWTATHWAYDFEGSYSYAAPASVRFGPGQEGDVSSYHSGLSHVFTGRGLMAFLFHAGLEWDRIGLHAPESLPIPQSLHRVDAFMAVDFRWSEDNLVRLQAVPGFYTDSNPIQTDTFNCPWAAVYTRIPSRSFQWTIALSGNPWRKMRYAPGGGFRWQINERWKLKMLLPYPQIEYRASNALHLWIGSELIGDSYRVSGRFGTEKGNASLNNALVDYQEIHAGTGLSWNILPLLELNLEAGYLLNRQMDFHNNNLRASSGKAPYGGVQLRYLFQISKDERSIPAQTEALGNDYPWMRRFMRLPR